MEISLTIIFLMVVVFLFRIIVLKKIKNHNRYCEPADDNYIAIPSVKIVNTICFSFVISCMALGLFLFEVFYTAPKFVDEVSWYVMIAFLGLSGLYYTVMLHTQYFYFTFGEDYIEFNLKIGKRSKDAIKLSLQEIEGIKKDANKYCIILKDKSCYSIDFQKTAGLIGSELLKKKLANFAV